MAARPGSQAQRKRPRALESALGMALIQWADVMSRSLYPSLAFLHHIPNGGARSKTTAGRLKAEGVRSGVWDYFLPVPARIDGAQFMGLYLELKVPTERNTKHGGLSASQVRFGEFVAGQGYATVVAYCWTEAQAAISAYLNGQELPFLWLHKVQHAAPDHGQPGVPM